MGRDPIGACRTHDPSQSCPPTRASQWTAARGGTGDQQRVQAQQVIVGVDTHKYVHVAVAIDTRGIRLALLHESELARTDLNPQLLHRPMRYDIGRPSPVI